MSIIARLAPLEARMFFPQPHKFHLESPNLFVEFRFPGNLFAPLSCSVTAEHHCSFLQELFLPATHLVGMQIVLTGDFVDDRESLGRFRDHVELEVFRQ
jgi:hypothetical protein